MATAVHFPDSEYSQLLKSSQKNNSEEDESNTEIGIAVIKELDNKTAVNNKGREDTDKYESYVLLLLDLNEQLWDSCQERKFR